MFLPFFVLLSKSEPASNRLKTLADSSNAWPVSFRIDCQGFEHKNKLSQYGGDVKRILKNLLAYPFWDTTLGVLRHFESSIRSS